ncbi:PCNA-associated factor-like isoform X2 [Mus pahari]|uniref:PCNA-associated factor-like isoform X2 n=1 Tax=Mus pahari TaxID=10093 RepID=UPI001114F826|nr:PCNA-associated factor-like isoform X2 [Mus pahari]
MVRTKANYIPGAYRKAVASQAPRKVLGSSTFVTNSSSTSRKTENKEKLVLCNLITEMMKTNRIYSSEYCLRFIYITYM